MEKTRISQSRIAQSDSVVAFALVSSAAACIASVVAMVMSFVTLRHSSLRPGASAVTDYRRRSILDVTRAAPVRHAAAVPPENPHSPPTPPLGSPQVRR